MEVLQVFFTALTLLLVAPVFVYCVEIIVGCWPPRRRPVDANATPRPRVAVLVPAHNEVSGIAATIRSIQSQLTPGDRLVVIADNCNDETASVARELHATALERRDEYRRGKGFALAFGLEHLFADPPEVVLFFDADCRLAPGTIDVLTRTAHQRQRPVQSLYLCEPTAGGGGQQLLSSLAFRFKNLIRATGIARLGGACHLMGTGMALPWRLVDAVAWATGNVVEDMQLGIDYALAGHPPLFVPEAKVHSDLPATHQGMLEQRRRWEHGFLQTALTEAPQLFAQAVERRSWPLGLFWALDLAVPPLALLTLGLIALWCATACVWLIGLGVLPLLTVTFAGSAFLTVTLLGWFVHCRDLAPPSCLLQVPGYVWAKIPLYLDFLYRRQQQWVRAERSN